jgi:hypothetical protein
VLFVGVTLIDAPLPPLDHEYVPPLIDEVADTFVDCPLQIVGLFAVTVGGAVIVTVEVAGEEGQLFTVYVTV